MRGGGRWSLVLEPRLRHSSSLDLFNLLSEVRTVMSSINERGGYRRA